MSSGRPSWLVRSIGLALARRALRRTLNGADGPEHGTPFAAVLTARPVDRYGSGRQDRGRAARPAGGVSAAGWPRPWSRGTGWSRP